MYVLPSLAVKRLVCICVGCGLAAELCKKLRQEQCQMRDEAEQLNNEIRSLEADVRYTSTDLADVQGGPKKPSCFLKV